MDNYRTGNHCWPVDQAAIFCDGRTRSQNDYEMPSGLPPRFVVRKNAAGRAGPPEQQMAGARWVCQPNVVREAVAARGAEGLVTRGQVRWSLVATEVGRRSGSDRGGGVPSVTRGAQIMELVSGSRSRPPGWPRRAAARRQKREAAKPLAVTAMPAIGRG